MQQYFEKNVLARAPGWLIFVTLSAVLGFAWYVLLYSRYPLYVTHVNWIYNAGGDALQHQLGWEWFRNAQWRFPLGNIQTLGYPLGTSVTYMDSIPLFAIPFKLLSPWLEQPFQYFGLWELMSVILQMLAGMLIVSQFTRSYALSTLAACMLVLSPAMMFRAFYHSSLSAHWILLAAIWFAILAYRGRLWRPAWLILFGLAMLIHLYYIPMLLPLWGIGQWFHYRKQPRRWMLAVDLLMVAAVVLGVGYSTGVFGLSFGDLSISGYGTYSWNLNGFFNPLEISSAFLKGMVITGGQYEGFSYLGLGNLLLIPVAVYLFPQKEQPRRRARFVLPFLAAAVVYTLFAISNRAFVGLNPVWDWPLPDALYQLFTLFRSSGRFIWPVYYFIVLFGLVTILRNARFPAVVIAFALLLQFLDLQPLYRSKQMDDFAVYTSPLQSEFWQAAAATNDHVVILPAKKVRTFASEAVAIYAVKNDLSLNYAYFARGDNTALRVYADEVWEELTAGKPDPRTLYLFSDPEWIQMARDRLAAHMFVCEVDGIAVAFSAENGLTATRFDPRPLCSPPKPR